MIDRYTTPEMRDLWSEAGKYRAWLDVEIAICEGLAHYGYIPPDAPALIRERARFDPARIAELEQETRHDVWRSCATLPKRSARQDAGSTTA